MSNKLKSTKTLDQIFASGSSSFVFPIKVLYIKTPSDEGITPKFCYAVSAPKRLFKKAVDRNRLKRQMRASVDTHLVSAQTAIDENYALVLIYIGKEMLDYKVIDNSVKKLFKNLLKIK